MVDRYFDYNRFEEALREGRAFSDWVVVENDVLRNDNGTEYKGDVCVIKITPDTYLNQVGEVGPDGKVLVEYNTSFRDGGTSCGDGLLFKATPSMLAEYQEVAMEGRPVFSSDTLAKYQEVAMEGRPAFSSDTSDISDTSGGSMLLAAIFAAFAACVVAGAVFLKNRRPEEKTGAQTAARSEPKQRARLPVQTLSPAQKVTCDLRAAYNIIKEKHRDLKGVEINLTLLEKALTDLEQAVGKSIKINDGKFASARVISKSKTYMNGLSASFVRYSGLSDLTPKDCETLTSSYDGVVAAIQRAIHKVEAPIRLGAEVEAEVLLDRLELDIPSGGELVFAKPDLC